MTDVPKTEFKPPHLNFGKQLLVAAILLLIVGIVVLIAGKFIFGGILALFGAVLGLGSQVGKSNKL